MLDKYKLPINIPNLPKKEVVKIVSLMVVPIIVYGIYLLSPNKIQNKYEHRDQAAQELKSNGIPKEQSSAYRIGFGEVASKIIPRHYGFDLEKAWQLTQEIFENAAKKELDKFSNLQSKYHTSSEEILKFVFHMQEFSNEVSDLNSQYYFKFKSLGKTNEEMNKFYQFSDLVKTKNPENFKKLMLKINNPLEVGMWTDYRKNFQTLNNKFMGNLEVWQSNFLTDFYNSDFNSSVLTYDIATLERIALWRLSLGMPVPQEINSLIRISKHKPTNDKDNKFYFKLNRLNNLFSQQNVEIKELAKNIIHNKETFRIVTDETLGSMKIGFGIDEKGFFIYYYDLWNIQPKMNSNFDLEIVSEPPEIYDRYYLSPEDFKELEKSGIDVKKLKIQIEKNTKR